MHRLLHVARADFLQRVRSRRLLVVFAAVAYVGYLVNVGSIELVYQQSVDGGDYLAYYGEPTAAFVGLKAALTGTTILLFGGFYLLKGTLARDRSTGVDQLAASTPITDREVVVGKWLSHLGIVSLLLGTLGAATIVNHLVSGVGATDPVSILVPVFLFGLPLGAVVAGVALAFESSRRLDGTLGNVVYFVLAFSAFGVVAATLDQSPDQLPTTAKLADLLGYLVAYELTLEPLLQVAPGYDGGLPSFGQVWGTSAPERYRYTGGSLPAWAYGQRALLVVVGAGAALAASVPYDRWRSADPDGGHTVTSRLRALVPSLGSSGTETAPPADASDVSLTAIDDRGTGSLVRLAWLECRMAVRGQRWWWYLGALGLVLAAPFGGALPRQAYVSIALVWPIFVWSSLGVGPVRNRTAAFVLSSASPYRQLLAEWLAGVGITLLVVGPAVVAGGPGTGRALALASTVAFVPSVALASGLWSRSTRPFELGYLLVWYVGPVNGVAPLDVADATGLATPATSIAFGAVGAVALLGAIYHRYRALGSSTGG